MTLGYLKFELISLFGSVFRRDLEFYCNILPGYDFVYEIPANGIVGGIGMFINNCCVFHELPQFTVSYIVAMLKIFGLRLLKISQNISLVAWHLQASQSFCL